METGSSLRLRERAGSSRAGRPRSGGGGFTLIEILVVVVIIGILGAVIVPNLLSRPDQARITAAQQDLRALGSALDMYRLDNFQYPSTDQGLDALVSQPSGFPEPKNWNPDGYIKALPTEILGVRLTCMNATARKFRFFPSVPTVPRAARALPRTSISTIFELI